MTTTLQRHPILWFVIITFGFAWPVWIAAGVFAPVLFLPATLLGAWAPTFAALFITRLTSGRAGLHSFMTRLFRWRVGWVWYMVALFGAAGLVLVSVVINVGLGGSWPRVVFPAGAPVEAWYAVIPIIFIVNVFMGGPLAEDVGWRGYLLPRMGERLGMWNASLVIGLVWAVWHLPFFFFPQGSQVVGGLPFAGFALLTMAWGVLFAWVYVNTNESILLPVLFHAAVNTTFSSTDVLGFGQGGGDGRLLVIVTLAMWLCVLGITVRYGQSLREDRSAAVGREDANSHTSQT